MFFDMTPSPDPLKHMRSEIARQCNCNQSESESITASEWENKADRNQRAPNITEPAPQLAPARVGFRRRAIEPHQHEGSEQDCRYSRKLHLCSLYRWCRSMYAMARRQTGIRPAASHCPRQLVSMRFTIVAFSIKAALRRHAAASSAISTVVVRTARAPVPIRPKEVKGNHGASSIPQRRPAPRPSPPPPPPPPTYTLAAIRLRNSTTSLPFAQHRDADHDPSASNDLSPRPPPARFAQFAGEFAVRTRPPDICPGEHHDGDAYDHRVTSSCPIPANKLTTRVANIANPHRQHPAHATAIHRLRCATERVTASTMPMIRPASKTSRKR